MARVQLAATMELVARRRVELSCTAIDRAKYCAAASKQDKDKDDDDDGRVRSQASCCSILTPSQSLESRNGAMAQWLSQQKAVSSSLSRPLVYSFLIALHQDRLLSSSDTTRCFSASTSRTRTASRIHFGRKAKVALASRLVRLAQEHGEPVELHLVSWLGAWRAKQNHPSTCNARLGEWMRTRARPERDGAMTAPLSCLAVHSHFYALLQLYGRRRRRLV